MSQPRGDDQAQRVVSFQSGATENTARVGVFRAPAKGITGATGSERGKLGVGNGGKREVRGEGFHVTENSSYCTVGEDMEIER